MKIITMILDNMPTILLGLLMFSILVFVHELGHFLTAKWSKIKVNEFAMGMGPTIFKRQKGETVYSLRLFPIGGFCAMEGEDEESSSQNAFGEAPLYKRMLVTVAGSCMNLLLGLVVFSILSSQQAYIGTTVIDKFRDNAVSNSQLMLGDKILSVNHHSTKTDYDMFFELTRDTDGIVDIEVARTVDGKPQKIMLKDVRFEMDPVPDVEDMKMIRIDFIWRLEKPTFWSSVANAFNWTGYTIKQVWGSLTDLITGRYGFKQVSGPVGVVSAIGKAAEKSWKLLFELIGVITVNLGLFNLLPLPALDGGRMMFLLLELVRRKPINPKYEGLVHGVGFVLLIGLMIFVTIGDFSKIKIP